LRPNLTKFVLVIFSLVVLAAGPVRADVHAGVEAYKQGDYETALREFSDLAESGDPRAQYNLAVMYLKGRGVEKDLSRAFELQRRAAEGGLAAAQHGLAIMYYRGEGVERDFEIAARWFRRAAERGFPTSQLNLGVMYFSGQGVERNDAEVVKWITLAAAKGVPEALYRLGRMYEQGTIFMQSDRDAIYWYGKSGERGFADGEKHFRRLTALLAARQAKSESGIDVTAGNNPSAETPVKPAEDVKIPDSAPPPAPLASPAPDSSPSPEPSLPAPEPQIAKSAPETAPNRISEPKPDYWRVQLASFRTLREAEKVWKNLKRKFSVEFEGLQPDVARVDLGEKRGVYHRLRASPLANREAAFAFCNKLKSKSSRQGCIPLSPRRSATN
jgi:uncharacterized protein